MVDFLLSKMSNYIDVIVPRGERIGCKSSKIFKRARNRTSRGLCHIYLDKDNNLSQAKKIILNAKMRRTSICGALETLLVNENITKSKIEDNHRNPS